MSYNKNSNFSDTDQNAEQTCVVCFKNADIYSVGICDHPVCYECSTRMRVLCRQNECPICRGDMPKVIFTRNVEPFESLKERAEHSNLKDMKFGLCFLSPSIQRAYYRLLEHECFICRKHRNASFRTFQQLRDHMRKEHELFYCDLCVNNLKIFTWERKCYTRAELGTHRRKGDVDNTSHRGHPLCEFCDTRFMDNDELFRHLRRDHLYCHFCDADGKHQYYNSYSDLRKHYMEEHYLCEEGDCKYEQFTSVFRTDIDLKAHIASVHGKHLSKAATKQARTLELEFTLAPRARPGIGPKGNRRRGDGYSQEDEEGAVGYSKYNVEPGGPGGGIDARTDKMFVNPLTDENFPSLSGDISTSNTRTLSNVTITSKKVNPFSEENFPSLGSSNAGPSRSSAVTITTTSNKFNTHSTADFPSLGSSAGPSKQPPGLTITRTVKGQGGSRKLDDFPSLSETTGPSTSTVRFSVNSSNQDRPQVGKTSNVSIHVNHKANGVITTRISQTPTGSVSVSPKVTEDFPALSEAPVPVPQWVPQKSKKQEPKPTKIAPAPNLPPSSLNDFPTLSKSEKGRKSASVTMPVTSSWVNLNNYNNQVKNRKANSTKNSTSKIEASMEITEDDKQQKSEKSKEKGSGKNKKTNERSSSSKNIILTNANSKMRDERGDNWLSDNKGNESFDGKNKSKKKGKMADGQSQENDKQSTSLDAVDNGDNNSNQNSKLENEPPNKEQKVPTQNGIIKKRSELKIDSLESNDQNDFPSLGQTKPPPGFKLKPPPGFSNFDSLMSNLSMYDSLSSMGNTNMPNDLTFTNSSGQSYSILPNHTFVPPSNFSVRNRVLFEKFMQVLKDDHAFHQFKQFSELFRNGTISASNYYEHCQNLMGNEFGNIFPELLILLPDIEKQQELYKEHAIKSSTKGLEVCATCKQVVLSNELRQHLSNHVLEHHFPVLENTTNADNVWHNKSK